jgi:hypothetical protein
MVFFRGPEKELWIQENSRCGNLCKIGFLHGPQKLNDASRKRIHVGMIDRGFTALYWWYHIV